ncbi:hypothetical protein KI387_017058, partial [Taxus chinensis]
MMRLPEGLGFELVSLQRLFVHSNKLTGLPYSTSHMKCLRVLDVHLNRLGGLLADLENLTNLETLNISKNFNYFVTLLESIDDLSGLVELDISYNHIKVLPISIARLKVDGNRLVVLPPHIVNHSMAAVKEYMAQRLKMSGKREKKRHSWLRQLVLGKWGRGGASNEMKKNSRVISFQEECVSTLPR